VTWHGRVRVAAGHTSIFFIGPRNNPPSVGVGTQVIGPPDACSAIENSSLSPRRRTFAASDGFARRPLSCGFSPNTADEGRQSGRSISTDRLCLGQRGPARCTDSGSAAYSALSAVDALVRRIATKTSIVLRPDSAESVPPAGRIVEPHAEIQERNHRCCRHSSSASVLCYRKPRCDPRNHCAV
jgi:hypothetical protein